MKKIIIVFSFISLFFTSVSPINVKAIDSVTRKDNQLVIINKNSNTLAFFENQTLIKLFPVATGKKDDYTPEGIFPIVNKIKNRPYYKKGIPGGDPRNPLGNRWLGLEVNGTIGTTYAIHGNNNPQSIGKYVSMGCIRMDNNDIVWLFDRIKENTNVIIADSYQPFEIISFTYYYFNQSLPKEYRSYYFQ
ncbi:L,D-transpeptidase [Metabacillus indicus]|uniref:L,D-transpeptidase n=1 Tax=Metabacillus indicus TaxID=246786 RepID=UPI0031EE01F7